MFSTVDHIHIFSGSDKLKKLEEEVKLKEANRNIEERTVINVDPRTNPNVIKRNKSISKIKELKNKRIDKIAEFLSECIIESDCINGYGVKILASSIKECIETSDNFDNNLCDEGGYYLNTIVKLHVEDPNESITNLRLKTLKKDIIEEFTLLFTDYIEKSREASEKIKEIEEASMNNESKRRKIRTLAESSPIYQQTKRIIKEEGKDGITKHLENASLHEDIIHRNVIGSLAVLTCLEASGYFGEMKGKLKY